MPMRDRDAEIEAARTRLMAVLAEAKRRRAAAAPNAEPIVRDGPRGLPRWVLAALAALAVLAGWRVYRDHFAPEPPAPVARPMQPPAPAGPVDAAGAARGPDWARRPSGQDIGRYYPTFAAWLGKEGRAVIRCRVTAAGTLSACEVVHETPKGWGFGKAALKMSALFQMRPAVRDGRSVAGAEVTIPIRFRIG